MPLPLLRRPPLFSGQSLCIRGRPLPLLRRSPLSSGQSSCISGRPLPLLRRAPFFQAVIMHLRQAPPSLEAGPSLFWAVIMHLRQAPLLWRAPLPLGQSWLQYFANRAVRQRAEPFAQIPSSWGELIGQRIARSDLTKGQLSPKLGAADPRSGFQLRCNLWDPSHRCWTV